MARLEIAKFIGGFQDKPDLRNRPPDTGHHDQSASVQSAFVKDIQSIVSVTEDFGNPFEEESQDLLVLDTKKIAPPAAVDALHCAHEMGQLPRTAGGENDILRRCHHRHKLWPASESSGERRKPDQVTEERRQSHLSVVYRCQNRDGNPKEFFQHENQACPPALSDGGGIRQGAKSDLLTCLEDVSQPRS